MFHLLEGEGSLLENQSPSFACKFGNLFEEMAIRSFKQILIAARELTKGVIRVYYGGGNGSGWNKKSK